MDLRKIKKLIELVEESGIAELEVKSGEEAVRITMALQGQAHGVVNPVVSATADAAADAILLPITRGTEPSSEPAPDSPGKPLKAPLSGTFYAAPAPDAQAFVAVGDKVKPGDVLCIVESMKMMNRIEADRAGTISAVLVPNGEPVETGQALFMIVSGG